MTQKEALRTILEHWKTCVVSRAKVEASVNPSENKFYEGTKNICYLVETFMETMK